MKIVAKILILFSYILIDEDNEPPKRYIAEMTQQHVNEEMHFKVFIDDTKHNKAIILNSYLEDWIIYVAKSNNINLRQFNLPNNAEQLHSFINNKKSKFGELLNTLSNTIQFQRLKKHFTIFKIENKL